MIKSLLRCLILIGILGSIGLYAESSLQKIDVFPFGMNAVKSYRIPGVVVTSKGTLLAYCEARHNSSADWGEIEIYLRRSKDQGKTWTPFNVIAHTGARIEGNPHKPLGGEHEQTVNNPVAIVDSVTGNIEFLYCINYARCFSMRSTDDGLTWSKPVEITATFEAFKKYYDWKVIATGPGHGIQLKNGRLVVPVWIAFGKVGDHGPSAAATIFSDDHGITWKAGEMALAPNADISNPNETSAAQLSDGRVMLVTRNTSKANRKLVTISSDGASGWSKPGIQSELWEPQCMASITNYPPIPGVLLYSCPHTLGRDDNMVEIPASRGKRENLTVQMSRDDGKTWVLNHVIESGKSAYSDLAVLPDGNIICLYESSKGIVSTRFGLELLTAKHDK
jgi:sialidase-1